MAEATEIEQEEESIVDKVFNFIAAALRGLGTAFAIISMFLVFGIGLSVSLPIAGVLVASAVFKEYAKVQASDKELEYVDEVELDFWGHVKKWWGGFNALLCAIGLEALFVATIVTTAMTVLAPISAPLAVAAIVIAAVLALITLPNDVGYYRYNFDKYYDIPHEKETVDPVDPDNCSTQRMAYWYVVISSISSSLLLGFGVIGSFAAMGSLLGPVGTIVGLVLGIALAVASAVGNYMVLMQTYNELSPSFHEHNKDSGFLDCVAHYRTAAAKKCIEKIMAATGATAISLPLVHALATSVYTQPAGTVGLICLGLLTLITCGYTAYRFFSNFFSKLFWDDESPTDGEVPADDNTNAPAPGADHMLQQDNTGTQAAPAPASAKPSAAAVGGLDDNEGSENSATHQPVLKKYYAEQVLAQLPKFGQNSTDKNAGVASDRPAVDSQRCSPKAALG